MLVSYWKYVDEAQKMMTTLKAVIIFING